MAAGRGEGRLAFAGRMNVDAVPAGRQPIGLDPDQQAGGPLGQDGASDVLARSIDECRLTEITDAGDSLPLGAVVVLGHGHTARHKGGSADRGGYQKRKPGKGHRVSPRCDFRAGDMWRLNFASPGCRC